MTIANVRQRSPVLRDLESTGSIKIAGSMYNLETGTLSSSPSGLIEPASAANVTGSELKD